MAFYPPCLNPNCKSHGQGHPNCHCYGGNERAQVNFADGGEVSHFCSKAQMHDNTCEYYADGGEIPADQVVLDTPVASVNNDQNTNLSTSEEIPSDKVVLDKPEEEIPADQVVLNSDKYGTYGQQMLTEAEGLAHGFAGPIATLAEKGLSKLGVPGLSDEDIQGRANANPWEHGISEGAGLVAGALTPFGEVSLLGKAAEAIPLVQQLQEGGAFARIGANAIKGVIQNAGIQAGDEATGYLLGQHHDPSEVASNILVSGALGGGLGLVGTSASEGLKKIVPEEVGSKAMAWLTGLGLRGAHPNMTSEELSALLEQHVPDESARKIVESGVDTHDKIIDLLSKHAGAHTAGIIGAAHGYNEGGIKGALYEGARNEIFGLIAERAGKAIAPAFNRLSATASPAILNWLSEGGGADLARGLNTLKSADSGVSKISNSINSLFEASAAKAYGEEVSERDRQKLQDYIENGGLNQQIQKQLNEPSAPAFADGGEVQPSLSGQQGLASSNLQVKPLLKGTDFMAKHYPELGSVLMTAKGRVNDYLNNQRPQATTGQLPFDDVSNNKEKDRSYKKALDTAIQPLSILNKVKDGSITTEDMQHFTGMYPELHDHLSKKITDKIVKDQMDGKKPAYKTRQGLSMFLGAPMDSTFTPANIQAAQNVFAQQGQQSTQSGPSGKSKGRPSSPALAKSPNAYLTQDQARQQRANKV